MEAIAGRLTAAGAGVYGPYSASNPSLYSHPLRYHVFLADREDTESERMNFLMYAWLDHYTTGAAMGNIHNQEPASQDQADVDTAAVRGRALADTSLKAKQWLIDLVACYQVNGLDKRNINGYYAGTRGVIPDTQEILSTVAYASSKLPNMMANPALRALVSNIKFVRYHTSASSTPQLALRFLESIPAHHTHIVTAAERAAVQNAAAEYWNLALADQISERLKMMITVFMEVNRIDIGEYYQGMKAIAATSVSSVTAARNYFTALAKNTEFKDAVAHAKTADEIFAIAPAEMRVGPVPDAVREAAHASKRARIHRMMSSRNAIIARQNAADNGNRALLTEEDAAAILFGADE